MAISNQENMMPDIKLIDLITQQIIFCFVIFLIRGFPLPDRSVKRYITWNDNLIFQEYTPEYHNKGKCDDQK